MEMDKNIITPARIKQAGEFVEWLRQSIHEQEFPNNNRVRAAGSCFAIAQDHHHAIVFLFENRLYSSGFALLRLEYEAYIRGLWLSLCASEAQIKKIISRPNWRVPDVGDLVAAIEKTPSFAKKILSRIKKESWSSMCSYTHTGTLHIQRWNTSEGIEPNYQADEIEEVLYFSEIFGAMSVLGFAELGKKDELALLVLSKMEERILK